MDGMGLELSETNREWGGKVEVWTVSEHLAPDGLDGERWRGEEEGLGHGGTAEGWSV